MNWQARQEELLSQLAPEVRRFIWLTLARLERENVFDAPGVIRGVVQAMRVADSDVIRRAVPQTEGVLRRLFALARVRPLGA